MDRTVSPHPLSAPLLALLTTLAMVLIAWQQNSTAAMAVAIPFAFVTYWLYFALGSAPLLPRLQAWCDRHPLRLLLLPLLLTALLFLYAMLNGAQPLRGNSWQIPLLFMAPALYYALFTSAVAISWRDIPGALLCILPYALTDYPFHSALPYGGGGIDTLYLTLTIIVAAYALLVARRLGNVGFIPYYRREALWLALKGWALLMVLVLAVGIPGGLLKWVGYEPVSLQTLLVLLGLLLRTLFGTAIPEELFFRALLLNLLVQWLLHNGKWRTTLLSALLLLPAAAAAGYTLTGPAPWFPLLMAALLWFVAWRLSLLHSAEAARYSGLLVIGVLFGLLHYHTHSALFIGLAMLAGCIYGYIYLKSGSLYYSALTHTLVNVAPLLLGFEIVRS